MATAVHATIWDDAGLGAPSVVLVHGTMTWGTDSFGFAAQRPLADRFHLVVMDRRGFGASPDITRSDYAVDAQDVVALLGTGAHLVGHSYGVVVAMLAAAIRPQAVRSLALIEPAAHRMAADHPIVATALRRMREGLAAAPPDVSAADWLRLSTESVGLSPLDPTPDRLRAARSASREQPCWEADFPLESLSAASWPKLIVTGTWETAPSAYRAVGAKACLGRP